MHMPSCLALCRDPSSLGPFEVMQGDNSTNIFLDMSWKFMIVNIIYNIWIIHLPTAGSYFKCILKSLAGPDDENCSFRVLLQRISWISWNGRQMSLLEENKISILSVQNNSSSLKYDINSLVKTLTWIQGQPNLPVGFDMKMILPHPLPPHHKKLLVDMM